MALVAFLRGINVGGHRRFRPSVLAQELTRYGVTSVGAAGTFVVRRPGSRAAFRAVLLRKLPFEAEVAFCTGREILRLEAEDPFHAEPARPDVVRFVSILSKASHFRGAAPISLPPDGEWLVRINALRHPFVLGVYRRHMKTIGYLGQLDRLFGATATTRSWSTIVSIARMLKEEGETDS